MPYLYLNDFNFFFFFYLFFRLAALPEKPPAIDWAAYKAKIPNAAFVDTIKQKYEALQIPYPKSNVNDAINAKEQELVRIIPLL